MSLIDNARDVLFASSLDIDKVLGIYTGTFELPSSGVAGTDNTVTTEITTNIDETTFFYGIYSIDGGDNWNIFNTNIDHVESEDLTVNPEGEYVVLGQSEPNKFTMTAVNTSDFTATLFFDYDVMYKVALLSRPNQGDVEIQTITNDIWFDSRKNYQKIAVDSVTDTDGTDVVNVISHNLGYIPKVTAFIEASDVLLDSGSIIYSANSLNVAITTTNVTVTVSGTYTGTLYTRIYYDD